MNASSCLVNRGDSRKRVGRGPCFLFSVPGPRAGWVGGGRPSFLARPRNRSLVCSVRLRRPAASTRPPVTAFGRKETNRKGGLRVCRLHEIPLRPRVRGPVERFTRLTVLVHGKDLSPKIRRAARRSPKSFRLFRVAWFYRHALWITVRVNCC